MTNFYFFKLCASIAYNVLRYE